MPNTDDEQSPSPNPLDLSTDLGAVIYADILTDQARGQLTQISPEQRARLQSSLAHTRLYYARPLSFSYWILNTINFVFNLVLAGVVVYAMRGYSDEALQTLTGSWSEKDPTAFRWTDDVLDSLGGTIMAIFAGTAAASALASFFKSGRLRRQLSKPLRV